MQRGGLFLHLRHERLELRLRADPIEIRVAREQRIAGKACRRGFPQPHRRVFGRARSRARAAVRGGGRVHSQRGQRFHRVDGRRRAIPRGHDARERTQRACSRSDKLHGRSALPSDEPERLFARLQRARARGREAGGARMAGVRVLHVLADGRTAGLQQRARGCFSGQHHLGAVVSHLRAGSKQSDERARPSAERSPPHAARHGQRERAADRVRSRGQCAVLQRQAVGCHGASQTAAGRSADSTGAARHTPPVLADIRRRAPVEVHFRRHR